jgi:LPXTG-site transpeptidase (sortase) family protein
MYRNHILRASSYLLGLVLLLGVPLAVGLAQESPYEAAVVALQRAGVIDVPADGNLRLFDPVNRAEALKVILKSQPTFANDFQAISSNMPEMGLFSDVNQWAWYAPYVELGFRNRIVTGYPDGTFHPEAKVKVEEAATMVARGFGLDTQNASYRSSADFPNMQNQWFTGSVSALIARGAVLQGSGLQLGAYMTRGELFDLVYRAGGTQSNTASVSQPTITTFPSSVQGTAQGQNGSSTSIQFASAKAFAISVPSIGIIDLTVTHPDDPYTSQGVLEPLKEGVGHLFSYPGEGSKVMIYGHSSSYPWDLSKYTKIFRVINKVKVGSRVYVTYNGKLFVYQVTEKKTVGSSDRSPFEPDVNGEELILYTCWPPDSISQRYLVHAVPVETIALK